MELKGNKSGNGEEFWTQRLGTLHFWTNQSHQSDFSTLQISNLGSSSWNFNINIIAISSWAIYHELVAPSHHHPSTVPEAKRLLATPGFIPPLLAFVTSIAVTNVVGAFMDLVGDCAGIDPGRIWDETASMEYGIGVRRKFAASRCFHVFSRVIDTRTRKYESNIQSWSIPHFQTSPSYSYIFFHQVSIV